MIYPLIEWKLRCCKGQGQVAHLGVEGYHGTFMDLVKSGTSHGNDDLVGGGPTPLKNDGVRQLG